ncbi:MAG: potassium transporter TrkA, partial [Bacteroidota bacterium]
ADRQRRLDAIALLVARDGRDTLVPDEGVALVGGDTILFCGTGAARARQLFAANNRNAMHYVTSGEVPHGTVWSWFTRRTRRAGT